MDPAITQAPPAEPEAPAPRRGSLASARRSGLGMVGALLVLPLLLVAGLTALSLTYFADPLNAEPVSADTLAEDYGIRVDLVAVTAAGGAVDVRFTVLDADKAGHLLHDDETLPVLIVNADNLVIRLRSVHRHNDPAVLDRASYFMLYPNPGGHVQAGSEISVVVAGVRLDHLIAQS